MKTDQEAFDELAFYTLSHASPEFIHQYAVDAFAAQTADVNTKPLKVVFAVVGLYLHCERGFTGRQAQLAHMELTHAKTRLPHFDLPDDRGRITVHEVLMELPGEARDKVIREWAVCTWAAIHESCADISDWLAVELKQ